MLRKLLSLFVVLVLAAVLVAGCADNGDTPVNGNLQSDNGENDMTTNSENGEVEEPSAAEIIAEWVEYSQQMFLGQSREIEGQQYLLVTYGQKDSDGYNVEIVDVEVGEEEVTVEVRFSVPDDEEDVTAGTTYPYALEVIDATGLPVVFTASGDERNVPILVDVDYLQPIAAGSELIKLFTPTQGQTVGYTFSVSGIINEHEGNVQYKLSDSDGTVLISGLTGMSASRDWKFFSLEVEIDTAISADEELLLEINAQGVQNGSIVDSVGVSVTLQD